MLASNHFFPQLPERARSRYTGLSLFVAIWEQGVTRLQSAGDGFVRYGKAWGPEEKIGRQMTLIFDTVPNAGA